VTKCQIGNDKVSIRSELLIRAVMLEDILRGWVRLIKSNEKEDSKHHIGGRARIY
jgi:hypothetical protein